MLQDYATSILMSEMSVAANLRSTTGGAATGRVTDTNTGIMNQQHVAQHCQEAAVIGSNQAGPITGIQVSYMKRSVVKQ